MLDQRIIAVTKIAIILFYKHSSRNRARLVVYFELYILYNPSL